MDLELLQQALIVDVQYDVEDDHLKICVPKIMLTEDKTYKTIKEYCYQWYKGYS